MDMRAAVSEPCCWFVLTVAASGCEAVAMIFEAGLWVGAIVVVPIRERRVHVREAPVSVIC